MAFAIAFAFALPLSLYHVTFILKIFIAASINTNINNAR